jgi:hypothetical protein
MHGHSGSLPTIFSDLFAFDPQTLTWKNLTGTVLGTPPSARFGHGFASVGGLLYVHGGTGERKGLIGGGKVFAQQSHYFRKTKFPNFLHGYDCSSTFHMKQAFTEIIHHA